MAANQEMTCSDHFANGILHITGHNRCEHDINEEYQNGPQPVFS
jgi:hypothetical protein